MPFGLQTVPVSFLRMIDQVLDGMLELAGAYMEAIVFSQSWEEHVAQIPQVLGELWKLG